jgi:RNA polymerase sigma-70 factor, ECF subfamily
VYRRFTSFRGEGSRRAWVFGIAEMELRAWRKTQTRKIVLPQGEATNPWPGATAGIILREAIHRLNDEQAGAFVLFEVQGFSVKEIAQMQEVPEGTVLSRLHAARQRLRKILKDGDMK